MSSSKPYLPQLVLMLEKVIHMDVRYLARGGTWLTLGYAASALSTFAIALVFANVLDPTIYGSYKYVRGGGGGGGIATLPGIDAALTRAIARGQEGSVRSVTHARVGWGTCSILGGALLALYYGWQGNDLLALAIAISGFGVALIDPLTVFDDILRGRKQFSTATRLTLIAQLSMTAVLIGTAYLSPALLPIVSAYFFGWVAVNALLLLYVWRRFPLNQVQDPTVFAYGAHLSFMKAGGIVAGALGSIILFHVGGAALAVFTIAVAPIEQVRGFLGNFESLFFPKFVRDDWLLWRPATFVRKTALFFFLLLIGVGGYFIIAPAFFAFFFPKYVAAIPYSQVWALSLIPTAFTIVLVSMLRAKQRVRDLYWFNGISNAAVFVCVPVLTYGYGIAGLVLGQFCVKFIESGVIAYLVWRRDDAQSNERRA